MVVVPTYELYPKALVPDMVRNGLLLNTWVDCCCSCVALACDAARPWVLGLRSAGNAYTVLGLGVALTVSYRPFTPSRLPYTMPAPFGSSITCTCSGPTRTPIA